MNWTDPDSNDEQADVEYYAGTIFCDTCMLMMKPAIRKRTVWSDTLSSDHNQEMLETHFRKSMNDADSMFHTMADEGRIAAIAVEYHCECCDNRKTGEIHELTNLETTDDEILKHVIDDYVDAGFWYVQFKKDSDRYAAIQEMYNSFAASEWGDDNEEFEDYPDEPEFPTAYDDTNNFEHIIEEIQDVETYEMSSEDQPKPEATPEPQPEVKSQGLSGLPTFSMPVKTSGGWYSLNVREGIVVGNNPINGDGKSLDSTKPFQNNAIKALFDAEMQNPYPHLPEMSVPGQLPPAQPHLSETGTIAELPVMTMDAHQVPAFVQIPNGWMPIGRPEILVAEKTGRPYVMMEIKQLPAGHKFQNHIPVAFYSRPESMGPEVPVFKFKSLPELTAVSAGPGAFHHTQLSDHYWAQALAAFLKMVKFKDNVPSHAQPMGNGMFADPTSVDGPIPFSQSAQPQTPPQFHPGQPPQHHGATRYQWDQRVTQVVCQADVRGVGPTRKLLATLMESLGQACLFNKNVSATLITGDNPEQSFSGEQVIVVKLSQMQTTAFQGVKEFFGA